jgi:hypothetical protein
MRVKLLRKLQPRAPLHPMDFHLEAFERQVFRSVQVATSHTRLTVLLLCLERSLNFAFNPKVSLIKAFIPVAQRSRTTLLFSQASRILAIHLQRGGLPVDFCLLLFLHRVLPFRSLSMIRDRSRFTVRRLRRRIVKVRPSEHRSPHRFD